MSGASNSRAGRGSPSRPALCWAKPTTGGLFCGQACGFGLAAHLSHFEARQERRTRPRKLRAAFAVLQFGALLACAPRPPETWKPLVALSSSYSASAACTLALGGRDFRASGGCAVDPAQGARVELRDPSGATLLLIIVTPNRANLLCPQSGLSFSWNEADRDMPWSPADLMSLFVGPPAGSVKMSSKGPALICRWKNGVGRVTGEFVPADSPLAFSAVSLRGPGRAGLSLRLNSAQAQSFGPEVFRLPEGIDVQPTTPAQILKGLSANKTGSRRGPAGMDGKEAREGQCWRSSDERADTARRPDGPVPSGAGGERRMALLASLERRPALRRSAVAPCSPGATRAASPYVRIGPWEISP